MKQFYAQNLYQLTEECFDLPKHTIVCVDKNKDWFRYVGYEHTQPSSSSNWPRKTKKGVQLYRDYWRHIAPVSHNCPYQQKFLKTPKTPLK